MASLGLMGADVPSHPCDVYLRNARWGGWVTGNRLRGLRPPSCPITETWLLWAALPKDRSSGDPSAPSLARGTNGFLESTWPPL